MRRNTEVRGQPTVDQRPCGSLIYTLVHPTWRSSWSIIQAHIQATVRASNDRCDKGIRWQTSNRRTPTYSVVGRLLDCGEGRVERIDDVRGTCADRVRYDIPR